MSFWRTLTLPILLTTSILAITYGARAGGGNAPEAEFAYLNSRIFYQLKDVGEENRQILDSILVPPLIDQQFSSGGVDLKIFGLYKRALSLNPNSTTLRPLEKEIEPKRLFQNVLNIIFEDAGIEPGERVDTLLSTFKDISCDKMSSINCHELSCQKKIENSIFRLSRARSLLSSGLIDVHHQVGLAQIEAEKLKTASCWAQVEPLFSKTFLQCEWDGDVLESHLKPEIVHRKVMAALLKYKVTPKENLGHAKIYSDIYQFDGKLNLSIEIAESELEKKFFQVAAIVYLDLVNLFARKTEHGNVLEEIVEETLIADLFSRSADKELIRLYNHIDESHRTTWNWIEYHGSGRFSGTYTEPISKSSFFLSQYRQAFRQLRAPILNRALANWPGGRFQNTVTDTNPPDKNQIFLYESELSKVKQLEAIYLYVLHEFLKSMGFKDDRYELSSMFRAQMTKSFGGCEGRLGLLELRQSEYPRDTDFVESIYTSCRKVCVNFSTDLSRRIGYFEQYESLLPLALGDLRGDLRSIWEERFRKDRSALEKSALFRHFGEIYSGQIKKLEPKAVEGCFTSLQNSNQPCK